MTTATTPTKFDRHADVLVKVDPERVTFGVEIECLLPNAYVAQHFLRIGGYHTANCHLPEPFNRWAVTHDGSLVSEQGFTACEIVSPVLHGLVGLEQVQALYQHLAGIGFKVNDSCGAHVHVGLNSLLGERAGDEKLRARVLRRLTNLVSQHEYGLIAITGSRRRLNNQYCRSIKDTGAIAMTMTMSDVSAKIENTDRYRLLNLKNLATDKQTVEFRVFAGTTSPEHALSYVLTALGLCHRACEVPAGPKFNPDIGRRDFVAEAQALQMRLCWHNSKRYGVPAGARPMLKAAMEAQFNAARHLAEQFGETAAQ